MSQDSKNSPTAPRLPGQLPVGTVFSSYYKLYRCSDGKYRISLFAMDPQADVTKRPISEDTVSSSTDVVEKNSSSPIQPYAGHCNPIMGAENCFMHAHCCGQHGAMIPPAGQRTKRTYSSSTNGEEKKPSVKRVRREQRTKVPVSDLIAEYIPSARRSRSSPDATPSSSNPAEDSSCCSQSEPSASSSCSPKWSSWIKSVGQRFPFADMSVRQVLDVLDQRPESPKN